MTKELFLEIGTEEIPAGFLPKAMVEMEGLIRKELDNARIAFGEVKAMATPRRLALVVSQVAGQQADADITAMGPAKKVAFNEDGTPTARGKQILDHMPMARFGRPEELVGAAVFLAAKSGSYVNGADIRVDGGFLAQTI